MSKSKAVAVSGDVISSQSIAAQYDDETQMLATRLANLKEETKWDLPVKSGKPLVGAPLQEWLLNKEEEATRSAVERGVGYMLLKREQGHGAFEGWLTDHGIPARTAQQAMKTAQLLMGLSDSNAQRVAHLPQRKMNVLARLPAPVVDDMFADGALDNIDQASYNQLQEIVQLRKQLDSEMKKNDRLNERVGDLDEALRKNKALPEQQLYIKELRRGVLEETEALRANAHALQAVMDKVALLPSDTSAADIDAIAHPLMFALQGLKATVDALFDKGFSAFTTFKADVDVFPPELDEHEAARAKRLAEQFNNAAQLRVTLRQVDLAPAAKGRKPRAKGKGGK